MKHIKNSEAALENKFNYKLLKHLRNKYTVLHNTQMNLKKEKFIYSPSSYKETWEKSHQEQIYLNKEELISLTNKIKWTKNQIKKYQKEINKK